MWEVGTFIHLLSSSIGWDLFLGCHHCPPSLSYKSLQVAWASFQARRKSWGGKAEWLSGVGDRKPLARIGFIDSWLPWGSACLCWLFSNQLLFLYLFTCYLCIDLSMLPSKTCSKLSLTGTYCSIPSASLAPVPRLTHWLGFSSWFWKFSTFLLPSRCAPFISLSSSTFTFFPSSLPFV